MTAALAAVAAAIPQPSPWPPVFHAYMLKNRSGQLRHTDLFYDWPYGGNLHIDRSPGQAPFYDNERQNGSTYYYTPNGTCKVIEMGVGLLPPNWLEDAHYGGKQAVVSPTDQSIRNCHVWTKGDAMGNYTGPFITYFEDEVTKTPARWVFFNGMSFDILSWEPGKKATPAQWQIPASCFSSVAAESPAQSSEVDYLHGASRLQSSRSATPLLM
ncbi:unnamed protein product [Symbiodinium necroappetens]|nr:unnamed protein product [Symbiodinium necroappetens]